MTESDKQRKPLPFEPKRRSKKAGKATSNPASTAGSTSGATSKGGDATTEKASKKAPSKTAQATPKKERKRTPISKEDKAIPPAVSRRMAKRMAAFSGVPMVLGLATLVASYFVITKAWFPLPNSAVLLLSLGFLGLSVVGLSYGVISASWDEDAEGSWLGWSEFTANFERLWQAWRSVRQNR